MSKITVTTGVDGVILGGSDKILKSIKKGVKKLAKSAQIEKDVARAILGQVIPLELEYENDEISVDDGVYTCTYEAPAEDIKDAIKSSVKSILKAKTPVVEVEEDEIEDEDDIDDEDLDEDDLNEDDEFDDEDLDEYELDEDELDAKFGDGLDDNLVVEEIIVITETKKNKKKKKNRK